MQSSVACSVSGDRCTALTGLSLRRFDCRLPGGEDVEDALGGLKHRDMSYILEQNNRPIGSLPADPSRGLWLDQLVLGALDEKGWLGDPVEQV